MIVLLRVIVTAVLIAAPFAILALASGKAEGAIWLMLPFVAAIPIFIVVLFIFLPAERLAASVGLSANLVVPMAGAAVGAAIAAAATYFGRKRDAVVAEVWAGDLATIGGFSRDRIGRNDGGRCLANFRLGGHSIGMGLMSETYDQIVLGSDPGGYVADIRAAQLKTVIVKGEFVGPET